MRQMRCCCHEQSERKRGAGAIFLLLSSKLRAISSSKQRSFVHTSYESPRIRFFIFRQDGRRDVPGPGR